MSGRGPGHWRRTRGQRQRLRQGHNKIYWPLLVLSFRVAIPGFVVFSPALPSSSFHSFWRGQFVCTNYFVCLPFTVRQLQRTTATAAHFTPLRFLYFRCKHFRFALLQIYCFLAGCWFRVACVRPVCLVVLLRVSFFEHSAGREGPFGVLLQPDGPATF